MEFNVITYVYLFIRLAPFIIVSCFTLNSMLNLDIRGLIYLVGLLLACFVATVLSKVSIFDFDYSESDMLCNIITLSNNNTPLSNMPLGQVTLSYTLWFIISIIIKYNDKDDALVKRNLVTFILFPVLIVCDAFWTYSHKCTKPGNIIFAFIVGSGIGAFWALTLDSLKVFDMSMFNGINNRDVCSRPSKSIFRCTPKNI